MQTPSLPAPIVHAFEVAVQAAAARVRGISRAEAIHTVQGFGVRYVVGNGLPVELEATPTASSAIARFTAAASADAQRERSTANDLATPRPSDTVALDTDEYMAPLGPWAKELVARTAPIHYEVFAVAGYRSETKHETAPRLAVCEAITREQWSHLERGALIIYTHTYRDEDPTEPLRALETHMGRFLKYDSRRASFYATQWNQGESDLDADAADVQQVYRVVRFLNVTPQPLARA